MRSETKAAGVTRREFVRSIAAGAATGFLLPRFLRTAPPLLFAQAARAKSRVAMATSDGLQGLAGDALSAKVREMFDRALVAYTGQADAKAAWGTIVKAGEKIGLKVNGCHNRSEGPTRLDLLNHVIESLAGAGVPGENIVVIERDGNQLSGNGWFTAEYVRTPGVRFWSHTPNGAGEGGDFTYSAANFTTQTYKLGTETTRAAKIYEEVDGFIQFPHLRPHGLGVQFSGALKQHQGSHIIPKALHKGKFHMLADLNSIPIIRDKQRLIVYDGVNREGYNGLFVGKDPVAMDFKAWQILQGRLGSGGGSGKKKKGGGQNPVEYWMRPCERAGLGTLDPAQMEILPVQV